MTVFFVVHILSSRSPLPPSAFGSPRRAPSVRRPFSCPTWLWRAGWSWVAPVLPLLASTRPEVFSRWPGTGNILSRVIKIIYALIQFLQYEQRLQSAIYKRDTLYGYAHLDRTLNYGVLVVIIESYMMFTEIWNFKCKYFINSNKALDNAMGQNCTPDRGIREKMPPWGPHATQGPRAEGSKARGCGLLMKWNFA